MKFSLLQDDAVRYWVEANEEPVVTSFEDSSSMLLKSGMRDSGDKLVFCRIVLVIFEYSNWWKPESVDWSFLVL